MLPRGPILVVFFMFFFPAARVSAAGDPVPVSEKKKVGDWVIFRADIPKGATFQELFLRTTLNKKAVAMWQPGNDQPTLLDPKYNGRVSFSKNTYSFNISSLRVSDGELYEVSMSPGEPAETMLNAYRLSVFNINVTAKKLDNSSCSLTLLCEAGLGPPATMSYRWTNTASRMTLAQGSRLQVVIDPEDKDVSYTCTATMGSFQSDWSTAPYEQFCRSGVAGLFQPGFLACSYLAKALLLPVLVSVLMLP